MIDTERWRRIWEEPDLDGVRAISTDDLEVTAVTAAIEPRHYKGPDAAVEWLVELRGRLGGDWTVNPATWLADDAIVFDGVIRFEEPDKTTGAESQSFAILMLLRTRRCAGSGRS